MEKEKKVTKKEKVQTKKKDVKVEEKEKKQHVGLTIIGIIFLIIVVCFIIVTLRKFYILNTYAIATKEYMKKDNYSMTVYSSQSNGEWTNAKSYYKDGKEVFITVPKEGRMLYSYKEGKERIIRIDSDGNKVAMVTHDEEIGVNGPRIMSAFGNDMTVWQNLLLSLTTSITEEECNGKDCYKVNLQGMKVWIDKESYLDIRMSNGYIKNSDGTEEPMITNYEYEFGNVTDEQVAKPDLTGYKIQER